MTGKRKLVFIATAAVALAIILGLTLFFVLGGGGSEEEAGIDLGKAEIKDPSAESLIDTEAWGLVPANQVMVLLEEGMGPEVAEAAAQEIKGQVVGEIELISFYQLEYPGTSEQDLEEAIEKAGRIEGVESAFPDLLVVAYEDFEGQPCSPLNDPLYQMGANRRAYNMMGMREAWDMIKAAPFFGIELSEVHVGVVDDKYYTGPNSLQIASKDDEAQEGKPRVYYLDSNTDLTDTEFVDEETNWNYGGLTHCTRVTQLICADAQNGGMTGVAYVLKDKLTVSVTNTYTGSGELALTKVTEPEPTEPEPTEPEPTEPEPNDLTIIELGGTAWSSRVLERMQKQIEEGATIINLSLGPPSPGLDVEAYSKAFERFMSEINNSEDEAMKKVLFVVSAGNEDSPLNGYNSFWGHDLHNLLTVAAADKHGNRSQDSNYAEDGGKVDICAPGDEILVGVDANGEPVNAWGTSYAAPEVTGVAAMIKAIDPGISAKDLKQLLVSTGNKKVKTGDQTVEVPAEIGGVIIRADNAVLGAINRVYKKSPEDKGLEMDDLLSMVRVRLRASGGPMEYKITASIDGAKEGDTTLQIGVIKGDCEIDGDSDQNVSEGESASWTVTKKDEMDEVVIKVTRLDSGTCSRVTLPSTLAGTYTGQLMISEVIPTGQTIQHTLLITVTIEDNGAVLFTFTGGDNFDVEYMGTTVGVVYSAYGELRGNVEGGQIHAQGSGGSQYTLYIPMTGPIASGQPIEASVLGDPKGNGKITGNFTILRANNQNYTATWEAQRQEQ